MLMNVTDPRQEEFGARVEVYRQVLGAHCYRMMGSLQDAEDMVQETFLRAWRRRGTLEDASSLRAGLYAIATNACLDALKRRPKRLAPVMLGAASTLAEPIPQKILEPIWLEPYPDALLLTSGERNPEELAIEREHIALAFIVALHLLPPRQRAVLLLRDVLDWPAGEVAGYLDTSVSAVKSALHRARAIMSSYYTSHQAPAAEPAWKLDGATQQQLNAYVGAWEAADGDALAHLLKEDATFSMPPIPAWYRGREAIRALVARTVFSGEAQGRWRLLPTAANGQTAFGLYRQAETTGAYSPYAIQVVKLSGQMVSDITTFIDADLFRHFDLPPTVSAVPM
jgi:RNA polymerase sigma-70 factor (ECF subfamily)